MKKLFFTLFLILIVVNANATTYYVGKSGSDENSCATAQSSTAGNRKLTVNAGVDCLVAGDILIIGNGTYTETLRNQIPSGMSSAPTTIKAENARLAILQPAISDGGQTITITDDSWITIQQLKISGQSCTSGCTGIKIDGTSNNIEIIDNEVEGAPTEHSDLITSRSTTDKINVRRNYLHNTTGNTDSNGDHAMYMSATNMVIEYNDISQIEGYGLQIYETTGQGGTNAIVRNNVFRGGTLKGAMVNSVGTAVKVYNNLVFGHTGTGFIERKCNSNTQYINNTIYNNSGIGFAASDLGINCPVLLANNLIASNGTNISNSGGGLTQTTNSTSAACMVNPGSQNFNLVESSACIDTGTVIAASGNWPGSSGRYVGAGVDIGAFEAPIRSTAVVEDAAKTKYLVSYSLPSQSTRNGVGLQTCTVGNWAIRDDGANMTESSCQIIGTSIVEVTTSVDLTSGVVDDAMTRSALPTLMDNVAIGDPNGTHGTNFFNAQIRTHAATAGTNNIGGGGGATFNVAHFRQINWYSSIASPTWKRIQDAAAGAQAGGRVAVAITIEGTGADPDSTAFELYFNTGGGDSAITDSVATNAIGFVNDAPSFADQAAISSLLSGTTCPHVTFVAGAVIGKQTSQPNVDLSEDSCTTLIVLLQTKSDASGTINIKPKLPGGTDISYGVTPSITIKAPEARS